MYICTSREFDVTIYIANPLIIHDLAKICQEISLITSMRYDNTLVCSMEHLDEKW